MSQKLIRNGGNHSQTGCHLHCFIPFGFYCLRKPILITCLYLGLGLLLFHCGRDQSESNRADGRTFGAGDFGAQNTAAIPVQAVAVKRGDISLFLMQTTTIEAERQVEILTKVSGPRLHGQENDLSSQAVLYYPCPTGLHR